LIEGVKVKPLKTIPDERGRLFEVLRCDEEIFDKFGQAYITTTYPGIVKAWHLHKHQTDNFACISGMLRVALYDGRKDSPTKGELNEFFIGEHNLTLIVVPPGVWHGWKCIGQKEALVLNVPTKPYNHNDPDEYRLDPFNCEIPYDWSFIPFSVLSDTKGENHKSKITNHKQANRE